MHADDPTPPRIVGGGINTSESEQPVVVTQMLGITDSAPVREDALRARFLSFDALFDAASNLVAHQLVLRGRAAPADAPPELLQMEEDMLLTGLYSLTQDGLTGSLPLLVRISSEVLFSEVPQQLNHRQVIWRVNLDSEQHLARALALQDAGLTLCPLLNPDNTIVLDSAAAWPYQACDAQATPPAQAKHLIVEGHCAPQSLAKWPAYTWFKCSTLAADTQTDNSHNQTFQLDLLAIALRGSFDMLAQFLRLNPAMAPRLLAIANSQAGGLSRPAESAAHALIMLGPQRSSRIAALLALSGIQPNEVTRHFTVTALTRALFMGKVSRLGKTAEIAANAFEIGLLSTAPHALSVPLALLAQKMGLSADQVSALSGQTTTNPVTSEGIMLQLAHACENNDADTLTTYSQQLDIPLHQISVAYLDALIAASALDAALL